MISLSRFCVILIESVVAVVVSFQGRQQCKEKPDKRLTILKMNTTFQVVVFLDTRVVRVPRKEV